MAGIGLMACALQAAEIHVVEPGTPGVTPAEPYDSWANAATDIVTAVGFAADYDTVLVSNGLYLTTSQITVDKAITLRGLGKPEATIVQRAGPGKHRIFQVDHLQAVVSGLTITNGIIDSSGSGHGGGVFLGQGTLSNCIVSGNVLSSKRWGGGVYCCTGLVVNCRIIGNTVMDEGGYGGGILITNSGVVSNCVIAYNNSAYAGGGVGVYNVAEGRSVIYNCLIYSNEAGSFGGGIYLRDSQAYIDRCHIFGNRMNSGGTPLTGGGGIYAIYEKGGSNSTVRNCLVNNNYSYQSGGGIMLYHAIGDVQNCTIVSNYAAVTSTNFGGGGGGLWFYPTTTGSSVFDNVILWDNDAGLGGTNWHFRSTGGTGYIITNSCVGWGANGVTHYALPPPNRGGGNFGADPMFEDAASANYRLLRHSPCVNTGINRDWMIGARDLDGRVRIMPAGGVVDIGCYEYLYPITIITIR